MNKRRNGNSSARSSGSSITDDQDFIKISTRRWFDNESYAKFQQVLEYLGDDVYRLLHERNNAHLVSQVQKVTGLISGEDYNNYINLRVKFQTFRFINNVGETVLGNLNNGDEKAEQHYITLTKVLLYHGLTSKSDTANFALVELEQLCLSRNITLSDLYNQYRYKFLRLIIKAILFKLSTNEDADLSNKTTSSPETSRSSWSLRGNRVITYMTRALEVFNVVTVTSEDVAQSLIIITNLILKEKYNDSIKIFLEYLARYQRIDTCTLIRSHIQSIVVSLLLRRKLSHYDLTESLDKLCSLCNKKSIDIVSPKLTFIKARLLLHFSSIPKVVTEGIYYLSKKFESNNGPKEDEFLHAEHFIRYLNPSMIGILLGVDEHFTLNKKDLGSVDSIMQITSLCKLISMLDADQVGAIYVKLLSTLSLLLRLRPRRDNQKLNIILIDLWAIFISKLNGNLKVSLLINICVALYDLVDDCPEEVAPLYANLLLQEQQPVEKLRSLFFIPNIPAMHKIYSFLTPHVLRENSVSNLQDLKRALDCVLTLMKQENQRCRHIALMKLKQILQSNQQLILLNMSLNPDEPLDTLTSKTIESLLALSSTQDAQCSALIAECLGILGAVNPIRLDHLIYGEIYGQRPTVAIKLTDPLFAVELIEKLKNSLFSDRKNESEMSNYALQVVIRSYSVFGKNSTIRSKLTDEAVRACELCQNTYYVGTKKAQPDVTSSVYEKFRSDNRYSYVDWVDKFSLNLISSVKDKKVQEMLFACSYVFKYNLKLAEFILPHAIVHMILNQPKETFFIEKEITAILDEDVGVSTQDLDNVYNDDILGNLQTLHFQCANMIFCALDTIQKLYNSTKKPNRVTQDSSQLEPLKNFLDCIPKDKLALLAGKCRSYARALCYFEQHLSSNKDLLDKYATNLQRIYVALDDTYEAAGVEMVRTSPPTLSDDIVNYEACGRFDRAFVCCATSLDALDKDADPEPYIENTLRCLSNQGDHKRLYETSNQLISDYPQYKRSILPHAIEAVWKLGKWDELDRTMRNEQPDSLLESGPVSQGYLLDSLLQNSELEAKLTTVRQRLMKPLSIAMMDGSAYFRGYQNLLMLHSICDFTLSMTAVNINTQQFDENTIDMLRNTLTQRLTSLFDLWDKRNNLVQPSLRSLEPLLVWQRSISLVLSEKFPFLADRIDIEVGRMWLTSADSAREARSFGRSFHCLTQARRWFGIEFDKLSLNLKVKYYMEEAKLEWDQGEQTKAIRTLKLSLERLKTLELYSHLNERRRLQQGTDCFPDLGSLVSCAECNKVTRSDRESFAQLKMLLTQYSEEAAAGIPETLFYMYEECVHLGVNQEETYFRLARYYDKLLTYYIENPQLCVEQTQEDKSLSDVTQRFSQNLMAGDKQELYTKLMEHSIVAFGNSLKYGVRYLNESMPRLLNIWYDLGSRKSVKRAVSSTVERTVRFIDSLKSKSLPPYYFMTAISLLLSRVCHPHSGVSKTTCEILELLLLNYPHQLTWLLIAVSNDADNNKRKEAANKILSSKKRSDRIVKIVEDTKAFSGIILELCTNFTPFDTRDKEKEKEKEKKKQKKLQGRVKITEITESVRTFDFSQANIMAPIQSTIRAVLPMDNVCNNLENHVIFPEHNIFYVRGFGQYARIFNSLQQPRQVSLTCHNGRSVHILCKSGDDLRKDSRCMEFLNLLNRILRRDSQSNARFFEIKTFLVLPLQQQAGIIEMVPNCESFKNIIDPLYKERNPKFSMHDQIPKRAKDYLPSEVFEIFKTQVLPKSTPPVLPTWFLRRFSEPTSWYMARLAFTRTAAVISMGGYIIGLGDRHLDNILIDTCNGRIVHVDFNLLFHQGETLPTPEIVPFRLTQNVVAAFGSMGTEGNFRKVCEITMRVMRKEKDALLTTLKPFMHDPCSEWVKVRDKGNRVEQEDKHENKSAKYRIEVTERKLKGYPRSKKFKPLTLIDSYSVEAQVDNLIEEATDTFNLSQMYFGWCPHV